MIITYSFLSEEADSHSKHSWNDRAYRGQRSANVTRPGVTAAIIYLDLASIFLALPGLLWRVFTTETQSSHGSTSSPRAEFFIAAHP